MAKAKTASKNNPVARARAKDIIYNGQKIKPVRYISLARSFMAAQYENGQLAMDSQGNPVSWSKIRN
mgnify:CR=1 FL=1